MLYKQYHQLTLAHLCPKGRVKICQLLCEQENYRTLITCFNKFTFYSSSSYYVSSNSPVIPPSSIKHPPHTTASPCMSAQQQLQRPLRSLTSLSTVTTDPSHTHRPLHQNPCTPIIYQLSPTTVLLIVPWFPPIFLQSSCSKTPAKKQHQLRLACSWCANCPVMHKVPSTQPGTILAPQAGRGEE